jgi:serine/threonine-protein kinase
MSPEQVRGQGLDGRSDQFSMGVIAYELLTGKKPFAGDNLTAVIFKIVSAEPAKVTDLCPWLVPQVDQVVARALAKKPEDRYANCRALAESFQAAVEGVIVPEGAEAVTAPGLDPVVTQGVARETAAANAETQISAASNDTTDTQVVDEPLRLPPIDRSVRAEPEEEEPSGIRTFAWAAGIAAAAVLAFSGAVEATAGGLLADPVNATQQAWAIWFGSPTEEATEGPTATVDESGIVFGEAEPAVEPEPDTTVVEVESVPATEEVALAQEAESVTETVIPVEEPEPTPPPVEAAPAPPPKRVAARTASVYFRTTPPGVTIVVDERAEWTCRTPCTLPNLTVGRRTVVARRAGFQTTRRTFAAGSEPEMIVEIGLEDARVQLLLSSQPDGADIYIDGRLISQKTNAKIPLPEGTYRIRVSKDGVGEAEQVVQVNRQSLPFAQFILEGTAP